MEYRISSWIAFLIIFLIILPTGYFVYKKWQTTMNEFDTFSTTISQPVSKGTGGTISQNKKTQIDAWIKKNDLNQFGDPKGTMYAGGTPLFDETTGKQIDRYEYIVKKHPDRPWRK